MNDFNPFVKLLGPEIQEAIKSRDWKALKDFISRWEPADIADLFREIDPEFRPLLLRLLPKNLQTEVFSELDPQLQQEILENLTNDLVKDILSELDPDDRTALFEELPPKLMRRLLNLLSPEDRKETLRLLGYPENSVGRLMTPDYVAVKSQWTVKQAIDHIREWGEDAETIDVIYVIDDDWKLLDDLPIRKLILADENDQIQSLMDFKVVYVHADADQEEAIKLIQRYNLIALPVTDSERHLLGIVTVDDILDAIQEEQTEDFTKFSAIDAEEVGLDFITNIKEVPLGKIIRSRVTWLLALLVMDLITGGIIQSFENIIARYVVLVTFLPVLVDTAGNAGSQSATLVIRALALGTVKLRDWGYLLLKELAVASGLGLIMGFGISFMGIIRGKSLVIAEVVVISMIINVIVGSLIGVILPFLFTKFKKDPATASTPLITTLADIIGTAIYLSIAFMVLGS